MKLFLYLIALLVVGESVTVEIPLSGQGRDLGKITKSGARPLRIAIVQMQSLNHDIDANLKKATRFSEQAATQGAKPVLFPELMPTGSYLAADTWDSAEPSNGETVQWMKATSSRLHIWIGAGFFEAVIYSSSWKSEHGVSCTAVLPRIPRQSGPCSSCEKRFRVIILPFSHSRPGLNLLYGCRRAAQGIRAESVAHAGARSESECLL